MKHGPHSPAVTLTQRSKDFWLINAYGKRVGTVEGNSIDGFAVRDIDYRFIGRNNVSAQAAMQAWNP